jgi:hypothetical protein
MRSKVWLIRALVVVVLGLVGSGCATPIAYAPNDRLLEQMSYEDASQELRDNLHKVHAPNIAKIEFTPESVTYGGIGAFTVPFTHKIWFKQVGSVEVYTNGTAHVLDAAGNTTHNLKYYTQEDASRLADLLMSFRNWAQSGGSAQ